MVYIFVVSLVLIMIGELADKSQLLALVLATRYRAWQVLLGIFISTLLVFSVTALVGQVAGSFIPEGVLPWVSGLLFVGFGIWTLRGDRVDESEAVGTTGRFGPIVTTGIAFFLAELGDKTQIMTMTIAADPGSALLGYLKTAGPTVQRWIEALGIGESAVSPAVQFWTVTLGATLGMVLADAVAIGIGGLLGKKLPERLLRRVSGAIFIVFGMLTVASTYL